MNKLITIILLLILYFSSSLKAQSRNIDDIEVLSNVSNTQQIVYKKNGIQSVSPNTLSWIQETVCQGYIDSLNLFAELEVIFKDTLFINETLRQATDCKQVHTINWLFERFPQLKQTSVDNLNAILIIALDNDDINTFNVILEKVPHINTPENINNLLISAAINNRVNIFKILINRGGNLHFVNENNESLLHLSINNFDIVYALLQHHISIDIISKDGQTPLHLCSNPEVATLLIEKGMDVKSTDNYGWTPLHYAIADADLEMVKFFLKYDIDLKNSSSKELKLYSHDIVIPEKCCVHQLSKQLHKHYKNKPEKAEKYAHIMQLIKLNR